MHHYNATLITVVTGNTVDLEVSLGFNTLIKVRFQLLGINTPEIHGVKKASEEYIQGMLAKGAVSDWFAARDGRCSVRSIDGKTIEQGKYGRWLARVTDRSDLQESVGKMLMMKGLAVFYGQPSPWSRE